MTEPTITPITRRKYQSVDANSCAEDEYTPPADSRLVVRRFGGNAAIDTEVKIQMDFDGDVFFVTHSTDQQDVVLEFAGDGTKKLTIALCNDSAAQETIGGWWNGEIIE